MTRKAISTLLAAAALGAAGTATVLAAMDGGTASAATGGTTLVLKKSKYGKVVFNGQGRALYLFGRDKTSKSTCYGSCARAWPPLLTKGKPRAGSGVKAGLLGTTRRKDGKLQVTYGGHPLYRYEGDPKGVIKCQGVNNAGGIWLVVDGAGKAVR